MATKRKSQSMFVIFAGPQQHGRPGTRYIAKDGSETGIKSRAAKFHSAAGGKAFAEKMKIGLSEHTYIGEEDFTEFEIHHGI
jgi:hypothetical protein